MRRASSEGTGWWLYAAAGAALAPTLFLQYVGEEAVTVIVAQEMWASKDFVISRFYGQPYGRPGLFAWLTLPVAWLLGWDNILIAARLVTVTATILTGLVVAWLVGRIFSDRRAAVLTAVIYLSGDVLFFRGWLAYADPLFSLLTFLAMACIWVATAERRDALLILALCVLATSFLAKTLTGFVYYAVLVLVLLWRHPNRAFLLRPISLVLHLAAFASPLAWDLLLAERTMLRSFLWNLSLSLHLQDDSTLDPSGYLLRLGWFPLRVVILLLPVSVIAIYCLLRREFDYRRLLAPPIDIAVLTVLINVLPYWLAPGGGPRYLMPLYPFLAIILSHIVRHSAPLIVERTVQALAATIAVAAIVHLVGFPLYARYAKGNYRDMARQIHARIGDEAIYSVDHSSIGVSLAANLNTLRAPRPPITAPPDRWESGFVLSTRPVDDLGQVAQTLVVGKRVRYLLCRGRSCG